MQLSIEILRSPGARLRLESFSWRRKPFYCLSQDSKYYDKKKYKTRKAAEMFKILMSPEIKKGQE